MMNFREFVYGLHIAQSLPLCNEDGYDLIEIYKNDCREHCLSFNEFLETHYLNKEYIKGMLQDADLYMQYLEDIKQTFVLRNMSTDEIHLVQIETLQTKEEIQECIDEMKANEEGNYSLGVLWNYFPEGTKILTVDELQW